MQGVLRSEEIKYQHDSSIPYEFDCTQLPQLDRNQVVFFDECHMDQEGGPVTGGEYQVRFPVTLKEESPHHHPLTRIHNMHHWDQNQAISTLNRHDFV